MESNNKITRQKEDYLKRLEESLAEAINVVDNTIMYITKEYNSRMTFHVELSELLKLRKEYNKIVLKHEERKNKLKKIYHTALKRLDECKSLPDSTLNKYLYDIRNEYRGNLPEGIKHAQVLKWKKNGTKKTDKEYKNMYSRINNLSSFTLKRMIESKRNYQKLLRLSIYYTVKNTMDSLDCTTDYDEITNLITECASKCSGFYSKLKNGTKDFETFINSFGKISENKLSLDVLNHIDKKINELLSEYISFLNDGKKYSSLNAVYNNEKLNFKRELSKYEKKVKKIKKMILHNLYLKYSELESIDVLNNKTTSVLSNTTDNMSFTDLVKLDHKINEDIVKGKKDFINSSYLYIIYFYASNDILNKMPDVVYDAYNRFCEDESTYDICFSILRQQYLKCYYSTYYDLITDGDQKYIERAGDNLRNNIERIVKTYMNLGIDMSEDLVQLYRDISKLDITSLYDLYERLRREMNIFNTHKEGVFSK